jgi:hypothetical protein
MATFDALSTKFESLLERLQTPAARKGMEAAFNASPAALGRAAVKAVSTASSPTSNRRRPYPRAPHRR